MRKQFIAGIVGLGLILATPAAAASAAPVAPVAKATVVGNDVTLSPGGVAKSIFFTITFSPIAPEHSVVVDLTAASRVADVTTFPIIDGYTCSQSVTTLTCAGSGGATITVLPLRVAPKAGVAPGAVGDLPLRVLLGGATIARDTVRVTVAESVELAAGGPSLRLTAAVGDSFDLPLAVRNTGTKPVAGAVLFLTKSDLLRTPGAGYRNCVYDVYNTDRIGAGAVACTFDTDVAPGRSYRLGQPIKIRLDQDVWAPANTFGTAFWYTPQDWADHSSIWAKHGLPMGHRGTGAPLRLEETVAARRATAPQTEPDQDNNYQIFNLEVTGKNRSNFTAQGATVTGTVGKTVKLRVSVRNQGPARLDHLFGQSAEFVTAVTMPPGTTVVKVAPGCYLVRDNDPTPIPPGSKPADGDYSCTRDYPRFLPRTTLTYEFTLRLDRVMNRSRGELYTHLSQSGWLLDGDSKPSDDIAPIYVTATAAGSTSGEGGNGGGGGLPITGGDPTTVALAGLLMILAGAVVRLLARRG